MQIEKLSNVFKENGEVIPKDLEVREEDKGRKARKGKLGYKDKFASETTAFFNRILPDKKKNKSVVQVDDEDPVTVERREKVKSAMLHAWTCYETYAWGYDELEVVITVGNSFLFSVHCECWWDNEICTCPDCIMVVILMWWLT